MKNEEKRRGRPREFIPPGTRFGRLTVLTEGPPIGKARARSLLCSCECGSPSKAYSLLNLRAGNTESCGCLQRERVAAAATKHGKARANGLRTRIYRIWTGMKERCCNPTCKSYDSYGGRGIKVCDRWKNSFQAFLEDMGDPPSDLHTLDRCDNEGDYEPGNCRWATYEEQMNNKRTSTLITHNGLTLSVSQWARKIGLNATTIRTRLAKGLPIERVLSNARQHIAKAG